MFPVIPITNSFTIYLLLTVTITIYVIISGRKLFNSNVFIIGPTSIIVYIIII